MRSLSLKLTLAFLFVGLAGIVLVGLVVGRQTQREFDQLVLNRYQTEIIEHLNAYYAQNGSWEGLSLRVLRAQQGSFALSPGQVILANARGEVILGSRDVPHGAVLAPQALAQAAPVEVDGETVGWALFTAFGTRPYSPPFPAPEEEFVTRMWQAILLGAVGAALLALVLGALLARTITRPIKALMAGTQRVAQGELGYQVPVKTADELGELTLSFNQMSSDLDRANIQRRQMTADIAHDLRTPLSVILGYTESLADGKLAGTPDVYAVMYKESLHLNHLIEDLRTLSLADAGELPLQRRAVAPAALLERTAMAHAQQANEQDINLSVQAPDDLPDIDVDPERMTQVLGNLVGNALRFTPADGTVTLTAVVQSDHMLLQVTDSGSGIAPQDLPYVFSRFYRGDKSRQQDGSSGLGLAIAKSIVIAHGGAIQASSAPNQGTTFSIYLPLTPP